MADNEQRPGSWGATGGGVDGADLLALDTAREARAFLDTLRVVSEGSDAERVLPILLLATSRVISAGARLGALSDVLPSDQFEEDTGPEADVEPLRNALSALLSGVDDYLDVADVLVDPHRVEGRISDDLVEIAAAIGHGLSHFDAGRTSEAMWWWQFSFLSTWGERAAVCARALTSILSHALLDADASTVLGAQIEALHAAELDDPAERAALEDARHDSAAELPTAQVEASGR